jgi:hypothetical protein
LFQGFQLGKFLGACLLLSRFAAQLCQSVGAPLDLPNTFLGLADAFLGLAGSLFGRHRL